MAIRLVITDAVWAELEPVLRTITHYAGSPPQLHDRLFIEAVLYQARTGIPGRDVPDDFGHWEAVYPRFRRGAARHIWKHRWQPRPQHGGELAHQVFIDATIMRAHHHAAGAQKKPVDQTPRLLGALGADFPPHDLPPAPLTTRGSASS
jgi:transposase